MALKVLYIGGSGQISFDCVHESVRAGHDTYVFNRGHHNEGLPDAAQHIAGDMNDDAAYAALADREFDTVCQFRVFSPEQMQRDIDTFTGKCGQYLFISSASAYQKPMRHHIITEDVPLENPYWEYSRKKADCETLLTGQSDLPFTIVRPSHTARTKFTCAFGSDSHWVKRMLHSRPVILPGDGSNLWTITRSEDFAPPFVKLLGNDRALGEAFHLTSDNAYAWNRIYPAIAAAVGAPEPDLAHVPTDTLVKYKPEWEGALLGDKAYTVMFDNAKIKSVVGDFTCDTTLEEFCRRCAEHFDPAEVEVDAEMDELYDRIIREQRALGE